MIKGSEKMKNVPAYFSEEFIKELLRIRKICKSNGSNLVSIKFFKDELEKISLENEDILLPESGELEVEIRFSEHKSKICKFKVKE